MERSEIWSCCVRTRNPDALRSIRATLAAGLLKSWKMAKRQDTPNNGVASTPGLGGLSHGTFFVGVRPSQARRFPFAGRRFPNVQQLHHSAIPSHSMCARIEDVHCRRQWREPQPIQSSCSMLAVDGSRMGRRRRRWRRPCLSCQQRQHWLRRWRWCQRKLRDSGSLHCILHPPSSSSIKANTLLTIDVEREGRQAQDSPPATSTGLRRAVRRRRNTN